MLNFFKVFKFSSSKEELPKDIYKAFDNVIYDFHVGVLDEKLGLQPISYFEDIIDYLVIQVDKIPYATKRNNKLTDKGILKKKVNNLIKNYENSYKVTKLLLSNPRIIYSFDELQNNKYFFTVMYYKFKLNSFQYELENPDKEDAYNSYISVIRDSIHNRNVGYIAIINQLTEIHNILKKTYIKEPENISQLKIEQSIKESDKISKIHPCTELESTNETHNDSFESEKRKLGKIRKRVSNITNMYIKKGEISPYYEELTVLQDRLESGEFKEHAQILLKKVETLLQSDDQVIIDTSIKETSGIEPIDKFEINEFENSLEYDFINYLLSKDIFYHDNSNTKTKGSNSIGDGSFAMKIARPLFSMIKNNFLNGNFQNDNIYPNNTNWKEIAEYILDNSDINKGDINRLLFELRSLDKPKQGNFIDIFPDFIEATIRLSKSNFYNQNENKMPLSKTIEMLENLNYEDFINKEQ